MAPRSTKLYQNPLPSFFSSRYLSGHMKYLFKRRFNIPLTHKSENTYYFISHLERLAKIETEFLSGQYGNNGHCHHNGLE